MKNHLKIFFGAALLGTSLWTASDAFADEHVVKKGETLWSISTMYKVNVNDLKAENKLTTNGILVGQTLYIPGTPKNGATVTYTVKSGDTLYKIGKTYNVSTQDIQKWNNLTSTSIRVGQVLKVSQVPDAPSSKPGNAETTYTVLRGDTLYAIATKYHMTVNQLKDLNGLTYNGLKVGQVLQITEPQTNVPSTPTTDGNTYTAVKGDTLFAIAAKYQMNVEQLKALNGLTHNGLKIGQVLQIRTEEQVKGLFIRPTEGVVTSSFGYRTSTGTNHYGTDFSKAGTVSVVAAADGIVSQSYVSASYGEVIFIQHSLNGKTYETVYAHLRENSRAVQQGTAVKQGQHIGYMGNTGHSYGQHLHFELHLGLWNNAKSNAVDPVLYLP